MIKQIVEYKEEKLKINNSTDNQNFIEFIKIITA